MTGRQRRDNLPYAAAAARLAERLRTLRADRGYTRTVLAERAGIAAATLAKIEQHQTSDPSFFTVAALAGALGCDLQQLADAAGYHPAGRGPVTAESIGYEGHDQASLVVELLQRRIEVLADVRLNAVSRRPGFSKTSLRAALQDAGIEYRHFRGLGNPQENRAPFRTGQVELGRAVFSRRLDEDPAAAELAELVETTRARRTAVFCVERDEQQCHRQVILDRIFSPRPTAPA